MCFLITMHLMLVDQSNWVDRKKITLKDSSSSFYNSNEYENVPLRILIIQISRHLPCTFLSNNAPLSDTSATYDTTQRADTPPSFFSLRAFAFTPRKLWNDFFSFIPRVFLLKIVYFIALTFLNITRPFCQAMYNWLCISNQLTFFFTINGDLSNKSPETTIILNWINELFIIF